MLTDVEVGGEREEGETFDEAVGSVSTLLLSMWFHQGRPRMPNFKAAKYQGQPNVHACSHLIEVRKMNLLTCSSESQRTSFRHDSSTF